jgi:TPR repeat protein
MLVDRGDELMKRADVSAGRLFYERAADAGIPEAALRLGASYDPAFLTRAGIKGVQGDPALAARWYKRARDLGAAVEAEVLLNGLNSR